ncbi:MAG: RHS repeat domain-containing protein [Bacteroidales bacterium]
MSARQQITETTHDSSPGFPPLGEREGGFRIGGDAYSAPVVAVKQGANTTWYYLLRDYLGNITHVVNTSNTVTAEYSYDAWGRRRDKDDWNYTLNSEPDLLAGRSFTSHEYLPWFKLVNMNGRLYDPVVGRFLSADNYVQAPGFSQSYNRYSYALNNPLKYADPTGEKWKWKWLNPFHWFDELMQWINDETEPIRDAMVEAGVPDFSIGATVNGDGNVNVKASYKGQEVFNTENIDRSNAAQGVIDELNEVRQSHGQAWHASSGGNDLFMGGGWHPPMALYNIDNAVNWLNNNAHESWKDAKGQCAYYVRMALEAGGINTSNHPVPARLYGSYLESWGFSIENSTNYFKGDIALIQGYPGATADPVTGISYGHIQMYNGSIWISDFKEYNGFWPGKGYRKYQPAFTIYRWGY